MKKRITKKPRWFTIEQKEIIITALDTAISRWTKEVDDIPVPELQAAIQDDLNLFKKALTIFESKTKHIKRTRKRRRKKAIEVSNPEDDQKLLEWLEKESQYY